MREEIESHFGLRICSIVVEVTDDKSLKKLADKISNVFDVAFSAPVDWRHNTGS